jgi:hypothetical protein
MDNHHINRLGGLQQYSDSGAAHTSGAVIYTPDDVTILSEVLSKYTPTIAPNHCLTFRRTENGQAVVALVADPRYEDQLSYLDFKKAAVMPMAMECELAFSGRARGWFAGAVLGNFSDPLEVLPSSINVTSWWQDSLDAIGAYNVASGGFFHLTLETALPTSIHLGDWVCLSDARTTVNTSNSNQVLFNATIRHIDYDRKSIVLSFADETVFPSAAVALQTPTLGTMKISFFNNALGATHAVGMRFSASSATANTIFTKMGAGDCQISGVLTGDQRITSIASSAPAITAGNYGLLEVKPTSRYRFESRVDEVAVLDCAVDSGGVFTPRAVRSTVKPSQDKQLSPRFYLQVPKSIPRPVARIASISKSGTTTATVITVGNHGLTNGASVTIKGVLDQTNFATTTQQAVITYISATSFSIVHGSAATATSYGGSVHLNGAAMDQIGAVANNVVSATYNSSTDTLTLIGGATWVGLIELGGNFLLIGALNTGVDPNMDGMWQCAYIGGTSITFQPIYDVYGNRVSPIPNTASATVGGSIILAPSLRIHDVSVEEWTEHRVMVDGAGTSRLDKALPVAVVSSFGVTATQGLGGTLNGTSGSNAWYVRPGILVLLDAAGSTVVSTSTTFPTAGHDLGSSYQVAIPVTAIGGSGVVDISIQESEDNVNWVTTYQFPRMSAVGAFRSPILQSIGRYIRYVHTLVSGTSINRSIQRTTWPFTTVKPIRRVFDYTSTLSTAAVATVANTAVLFSEGCSNVQMILNLGASTTPASFKMQGSEDNVNWYDIPGSTLAGVASSTVQVTVGNVAASFVRPIVTAQGATSTFGFVAVKAWG